MPSLLDLYLPSEHAPDEELLLEALDLAAFYAREVLRSSEDANARELAARLIAIFAPRGDAS